MIILICCASMAVSSEIWALTFHSTSHLLVLLGPLGVTERGVRWTPNLKEFKSLTAGTGYYRRKSKSPIVVRSRGVMDKRSDQCRKSRWLQKFANQHFPLLSAWQINGSVCLRFSCVEWRGGGMRMGVTQGVQVNAASWPRGTAAPSLRKRAVPMAQASS